MCLFFFAFRPSMVKATIENVATWQVDDPIPMDPNTVWEGTQNPPNNYSKLYPQTPPNKVLGSMGNHSGAMTFHDRHVSLASVELVSDVHLSDAVWCPLPVLPQPWMVEKDYHPMGCWMILGWPNQIDPITARQLNVFTLKSQLFLVQSPCFRKSAMFWGLSDCQLFSNLGRLKASSSEDSIGQICSNHLESTLFGCTTRNPPKLYIHDILHHSAIIKPSFNHQWT